MIPISLYTQIFFQSEEARTTNDRPSSDAAIPTESLVGGRAIPGSLSIDDQLEFARLHDWQVRRLGALNVELPMDLCHLRSVVHQAAGFRKLSTIVDGGNRMARRQGGQLPRR